MQSAPTRITVPIRCEGFRNGPIRIRFDMIYDSLYHEPAFRRALEACDACFHPLAGWSILKEFRSDATNSRNLGTERVQPLILALEIALAASGARGGSSPR